MSRLGGGGLTVSEIGDGFILKTHDSMSHAIERCRFGNQWYQGRKRKDVAIPEHLYTQMLKGDGNLERLKDEADKLIDDALIEDPRLVRRAGWVKDEDGVDADAALVASGEERCCLNRRKLRLADASTLEPVRVVISTDSKHTSEQHAIAFMAAAKISQQFRPLEIWWQGAWLTESYEPNGFVGLTPLLRNELDFGRLQFVLSNPMRDYVSYNLQLGYTIAENELAGRPCIRFGGETGKQSFLPDTIDFVDEAGIRHDPRTVARYAAKWAGLDSIWKDEVYGWEAAQSWNPKPYEYTPPSEETRRRWDEDARRRERERAAAIKERLNAP